MADAQHLKELTDDIEPRRLHDEAAQSLQGKLVRMRSTFDGLYGSGRKAERLTDADGRTFSPMLIGRLLAGGHFLRQAVVAARPGRPPVALLARISNVQTPS